MKNIVLLYALVDKNGKRVASKEEDAAFADCVDTLEYYTVTYCAGGEKGHSTETTVKFEKTIEDFVEDIELSRVWALARRLAKLLNQNSVMIRVDPVSALYFIDKDGLAE
jgi:hypothetical protein